MALELDDTQAAVLLALLGLPEDTTDVQLVIDTVKDATRDPMLPPVAASKPSEIAAAAAKHGMEVLDTATADALRRGAATGRQIAAAAAKAKVEAAVDDAISTGRITPARKKHWVTLCENDEAMLERLASIAPGTAVPLDEVGHSADNADLAEPATWFYS
jgi:Mu-like prophage I protein